MAHLCHGRDSWSRRQFDLSGYLAGGGLLGAVAGDVTSLTALVASLAGSVERSSVRRSAVAGDVAELATGVALHGLSLAVASKVVGAAAFIASGRARVAGEAAASEPSETATRYGRAPPDSDTSGVGARAGQVAGLPAVVAAAIRTGTGQTEGRAVSLDVSKSLAVVALLGLGSARQGTLVRLVARLLAVVAEAFSRGADLGIVANVATLVACTARQGRHGDEFMSI